MSSTTKTIMSSEATDALLRNVLVLQRQAFEALSAEHHRQVEAFIQQAGRHPLRVADAGSTSSAPVATSAHTTPVSLRSGPPPAVAAACALSDAVSKLTRENCDGSLCVSSGAQLRRFLAAARDSIRTVEERIPVLFVVDATLERAHARAADGDSELARLFETEKGFDLLVDWFAEACSYRVEPSKGFATLVLHVLRRRRPVMPYTRKRCVQRLRPFDNHKLISSKATRQQLRDVIELFRQSA